MSKKKINKVSIIMGSQSDFKTMKLCQKILKLMKVKFETKVISAHRTPDRMIEYAKKAEKNANHVIWKVLICTMFTLKKFPQRFVALFCNSNCFPSIFLKKSVICVV